MKLTILFSFLLLILALPVDGRKYENKNYEPKQDSLPVTVAIMPVCHEDAWVKNRADSIFGLFYHDSGLVTTNGPESFREQVADDSTLMNWLARISSYEYSKEQLKAGPSLLQVLDSGEVTSLANAVGNPDLLLIPIRFGLGSILDRAAGDMSLRMFDMRTGRMVFERDKSLNVDLRGEIGAQYIIHGLVSMTHEPYQKLVLDKLRGQK